MEILGNVYPLEHPIFQRQIADSLRPHESVMHIAMGCFWGAERIFWQTPGVTLTAVGYTGGNTPNPTYREVCTGLTWHAESVRVVFDTREVSLAQLLQVFWENHDPTTLDRQGNDVGTQYRSAFFALNEEQFELANAIAAAYNEQLLAHGRNKLVTEIVKPDQSATFWLAEPEHQQYLFHHPDGYCIHGPNGVTCPLPTKMPTIFSPKEEKTNR